MVADYQIVIGLSRVCEYVYRKGVLDGAVFGQPEHVLKIAEREDGYTTLMFLNEENGIQLSYLHYRDYIVVFCAQMKAANLRNFLIYQTGYDSLKKAMCIIVDYVYRKGLIDGTLCGVARATKLFNDVGVGSNHERIDGTKPSTIEWIEEIKHYANRISNTRKSLGMPPMSYGLSNFIGKSILKSKVPQSKFKYETEEWKTK